MSEWRVLPLTVADQQRHIEQSEALLAGAQPGESATLYWSMAEPEGIVLGFSQKPDTINQATLADRHIPIYHRRAGGTAVLVGPHLLSLDVVLPAGHPLILADVVESYRWFGAVWVAALARLDVRTATIAPHEAHERQRHARQGEAARDEAILRRACYASLSPYEVVAGERKVVGLDMIRRRTGSLLQAGVLLQWRPETLVHLLGHTQEERAILRQGLPQRAVGLDTLAGRVIAPAEVIEAFQHVLREL
ncbi:MAG: ligase [Ktedonobacteraceae bacterium]|nr:ligase [Ktedonobacteraceae bacterium]